MFGISFLSTGTTATQTPVMASIAYEIVKYWMKTEQENPPDFPLACVFDLSNMYTTLQFFASDKILMRMGELTSLKDELSVSSEPDWSRCSFPSKFVHKDTNDPLFFMIPIFSRGVTSFLTKTEAVSLTKVIWDISKAIEKEGCKYIFFDLPIIQTTKKDYTYSVIPALLNSNHFVGVFDCNKPNYRELKNEINMLQIFLSEFNTIAKPALKLNGLLFNQVSESVKSQHWLENVVEDFSLPIYGKISQDPQFSKITSQYIIPTIDSLFNQMRCAKDFQLAAERIIQDLHESITIRKVDEDQNKFLEDNIYNF